MNTKANPPPNDAFGRLITKVLENEAKRVCTLNIRDKMRTKIFNEIGFISESSIAKLE